MTTPLDDNIPTDQAWREGRRIYVRCAYGSALDGQLRAIGAKWDGEKRALWVGSGKLDKVLPLVRAKLEKVARIEAIKRAGRWVRIPFEAVNIRNYAHVVEAVFDGDKKLWAMPSDESLVEVRKLLVEYDAERTRRAEAEKAARQVAAAAEAKTAAQTAADREADAITRSGRTLVSDERGTAHGRLHGRMRRPDAEQRKPQPGEVHRLDDGRRVLVLSCTVDFYSQDAIDDGTGWPGSWEEPGWFYVYRYVVVEPTADERAADEREAAEQADEREIRAVMEAAHRAGELVDEHTRPEGPSIIATAGSVMPRNDGTLTLVDEHTAVWKHPGYYDDYVAVTRRITDPQLVARIRAIIAAGPRHRSMYEVRAAQSAATERLDQAAVEADADRQSSVEYREQATEEAMDAAARAEAGDDDLLVGGSDGGEPVIEWPEDDAGPL